MRFIIEPLSPQHISACALILEELPEWFGIESFRRRFIEARPANESYAAVAESEVMGFISLRQHFPHSVEIEAIAVDRNVHRQGIGRALVEHAQAALRPRGVEYLSVKTLGPSMPDEHYAGTRAFYDSLGFRALVETTAFWDEENPCLMMVMRL